MTLAKQSIYISNLSPSTTRDTTELYFESTKRSGGGDIQDVIFYGEVGEAVVIFNEVEVAQRILCAGGSCVLDGFTLVIRKVTLGILKDMRTITVTGVADMDRLTLELLFESSKVRGGDVEELELNPQTKVATITFVDISVVLKLLQQSEIKYKDMIMTLSPAGIAPTADPRVVMVTEMASDTEEEVLELFFDSEKKSNGGSVENVQYNRQERLAFITFEEETVAERVLSRGREGSLTLNGAVLHVQPAMMKKRTQTTDSTANTEVPNVVHARDTQDDNSLIHSTAALVPVSSQAAPSGPGFKLRENCAQKKPPFDARTKSTRQKPTVDVREKSAHQDRSSAPTVNVRKNSRQHNRLNLPWSSENLCFNFGISPAKYRFLQNSRRPKQELLSVVQKYNFNVDWNASQSTSLFVRYMGKITENEGYEHYMDDCRNALSCLFCKIYIWKLPISPKCYKETVQDIKPIVQKVAELYADYEAVEYTICIVGWRDTDEKIIAEIFSKKAATEEAWMRKTNSERKEMMLSPAYFELFQLLKWEQQVMQAFPNIAIQVAASVILTGLPKEVMSAQKMILVKFCDKVCSQALNLTDVHLNLLLQDYYLNKFHQTLSKLNLDSKIYLDIHSLPLTLHSLCESELQEAVAVIQSMLSEAIFLLNDSEFRQMFVCLEPPQDIIIGENYCDILMKKADKWQKETGTKVEIQITSKEGKPGIHISALHRDIKRIGDDIRVLVKDAELSFALFQMDSTVKPTTSLDLSAVKPKIPPQTTSNPLVKETFRNCEVTAYCGKVDDFRSDAIIVPATPNLSSGHSALTKNVYSAGGPELLKDCQVVTKMWPPQPGGVVMTSGGTSKWRHIIHAVCPVLGSTGDTSMLQQVISDSLDRAEKYQVQSICMPLLGLNYFNFTTKSAGDALYVALTKFINNKPRFVRKLLLFDMQQDIAMQLKKIVEKTAVKLQSNNPAVQSTMPQPTNSLSGTPVSTFPTSHGLTLRLDSGSITTYSTDVIVNSVKPGLDLSQGVLSQTILSAAGSGIQKECNNRAPLGLKPGEMVVTSGGNMANVRNICHVVLDKWQGAQGQSEKQLHSVVTNCLHHTNRCRLTNIVMPALGTGYLGFPGTDVARIMCNAVLSFANAHPKTTVNTVVILVYHRDTRIRQDFQAYMKNLKPGATGNPGMAASIQKWLASWQQQPASQSQPPRNPSTSKPPTNPSTSQPPTNRSTSQPATNHSTSQPAINRSADGRPSRPLDMPKLPSSWTSFTSNADLELKLVDQTSTEYKEVESHFRKTCSNNIFKIERVQNKTLMKHFMLHKEQLKKQNSPQTKNERHLFHATDKSIIDKIMKTGFNRSYAGSASGCWYGKGVYFARDATLSLKFVKVDTNGHSHMLRCRVLSGEFTKGTLNQSVPPQKPNSQFIYDSLVDNEQDPKEFVIFQDNGAYPEYFITFKK